MRNLADIGFGIVEDDDVLTDPKLKLMMLGSELGLDEEGAKAAMQVLMEASQTKKRIKQAIVDLP